MKALMTARFSARHVAIDNHGRMLTEDRRFGDNNLHRLTAVFHQQAFQLVSHQRVAVAEFKRGPALRAPTPE